MSPQSFDTVLVDVSNPLSPKVIRTSERLTLNPISGGK